MSFGVVIVIEIYRGKAGYFVRDLSLLMRNDLFALSIRLSSATCHPSERCTNCSLHSLMSRDAGSTEQDAQRH